MKYSIGTKVSSNKEFRFEAGPYFHFYSKLPMMTVVAYTDDNKYRCAYNASGNDSLRDVIENENL